MKKYTVEVYTKYHMGQHIRQILAVYNEVVATSKKDAIEAVKAILLGQKAKDVNEAFPIDMKHDCNAKYNERGCWMMTLKATQEHEINEYDLQEVSMDVYLEK